MQMTTKYCNILSQEVVFAVNDADLEAVDSFRYLGCPLVVDSSDWLVVTYNLKRDCNRWSQVSSVTDPHLTAYQ
jgi:hypothetical protein